MTTKNLIISLFVLISLNLTAQTANKLAQTPPLGWNSWDCYGMVPTDADMRKTADYMAKYMKSAGYEYVVLDMGWDFKDTMNTFNFKMKKPDLWFDKYGRLTPNPGRFPYVNNGKGLKPLADYIHSLGLKFGIHIQRGIPYQAVEQNTPIKGTKYTAKQIYTDSMQCVWYQGMKSIDMKKPGAQEYYNSLFELYAEWEVDFVKADDMREADVIAVSKAIKNCGRTIVLSLVGGTKSGSKMLYENNVNMWRVSGDVWDNWAFMDRAFSAARRWQKDVKPGHWPDLDMLPLGRLRINGTDGILANEIHKEFVETVDENSRLTKDEQYSLMNLWAIFRTPLMMGGSLVDMDKELLDMLTNKNMLAVNQHSINNKELRATPTEVIWTADEPGTGAKYVAVFNLSDKPSLPINVNWSELGINGEYEVSDVWTGNSLGTYTNYFQSSYKTHASGLYKLIKK
jgi:hypothetical protein